MKKLLVFLKNYKKELIFGPFFKLLEAIFELIVPVVMAKIIDKGIGCFFVHRDSFPHDEKDYSRNQRSSYKEYK